MDGKQHISTNNESGFVRVTREWNKQRISLRFPMTAHIKSGRETPFPQVDYFKKNRAIATLTNVDSPFAYVTYGPLVFAYPIRDETPNDEIPGQEFNYALLEKADPLSPGEVSLTRHPMPAHWDWPLASPIELTISAKRFDWHPSELQPLPKRPVGQGSAGHAVLIPYGCTKFRVTMFPVVQT